MWWFAPSMKPIPLTPDEHAARADFLLSIADTTYEESLRPGRLLSDSDISHVTMIAMLAQAHATLALRPVQVTFHPHRPPGPPSHVPTNEVVDYEPGA